MALGGISPAFRLPISRSTPRYRPLVSCDDAIVADGRNLKFQYASALLFILILTLSKLSMVVFFQGLTVRKRLTIGCRILLLAVLAWAVFSIFAIALECDLPDAWLYLPERCVGQVSRCATSLDFFRHIWTPSSSSTTCGIAKILQQLEDENVMSTKSSSEIFASILQFGTFLKILCIDECSSHDCRGSLAERSMSSQRY